MADARRSGSVTNWNADRVIDEDAVHTAMESRDPRFDG
jgi:hypothetical protein